MTQQPPAPRTSLAAAIRGSCTGPDFEYEAFFDHWFRGHNRAYFFLFHKNLTVTNLQYAELLALLQVHTSEDTSEEPIQLQFISQPEFSNLVSEIVRTFNRATQKPWERSETIARIYEHVFRRMIVVDPFYGSCGVYLPPNLSLNLSSLCGESGYLHSCGYNVHSRNVNKATEDELCQRLSSHLARHPPLGTTKKLFSVYAHEGFSEFDRESVSQLRNGLDDVKIYVEKFHMGQSHLVDVLANLRKHFAATLEIPGKGDLRGTSQLLREKGSIDDNSTIWLISDRAIGEDGYAGPERYYICYEQLFRNANPLHLFDENLPAWISPTTIPQTLIGASFNLTRPYWPGDRDVRVGDPFVGSGAVWLESLKLKGVKRASDGVPTCRDMLPLADRLAQDNLGFFARSTHELETLVNAIDDLRTALSGGKKVDPPGVLIDPLTDSERAFNEAVQFRQRFIRDRGARPWTEGAVAAFEALPSFARQIFYVGLKTSVRNMVASDWSSAEWRSFLGAELGVLRNGLLDLLELRRLRPVTALNGDGLDSKGYLKLIKGPSEYSPVCMVDLPEAARYLDDAETPLGGCDILVTDCPTADVVITDPPYAFNAEADLVDLAQVYASALERIVHSLVGGGQLVISLLDTAHTGRESAYFIKKEMVLQQVRALADECGLEVTRPDSTLVRRSVLLSTPYYWQSERVGIRRVILHLRFAPR